MQERNNLTPQATVALRDLFNLKDWQKIQDNFSAVTQVSLRVYDAEGNLVSQPSSQPRLCQEVVKKALFKKKVCELCLPTFLGGESAIDKNLSYSCLDGLQNFFVPLQQGKDKVLGYVIMGPVILVARKAKNDYLGFSEDLNIDPEEFWRAILEIKVVSWHYMQSLKQLITDVFEYIVNLAAFSAEEKGRGEGIMGIAEPSSLSRMFEILLDVALEVSRADTGSIMILDDKKRSLSIRHSRGLPEDIARDSRVNLGEGISGIAAQEGSSFLLDKNTRDERIIHLLKRPKINSAMVLPLRLRGRIVGVINLDSYSPAINFSQENISTMHKLIDLVNVTVSPVN